MPVIKTTLPFCYTHYMPMSEIWTISLVIQGNINGSQGLFALQGLR